MDGLRFNAGNTEASFLANCTVLLMVLFTLDIFKTGWPEDKLGSESVLQKCLDWFKQTFECALTGHHGQIASRNVARKDLAGRIQKILCYLSVMADERDIAALVNSGVVELKSAKKKARKTGKTAVATSK